MKETEEEKIFNKWIKNKEDLTTAHVLNAISDALEQGSKATWTAYDWNDRSSRPTEYGKYFICRKDGKVHWETWNGTGFAYNNNVITHWMKIVKPRIYV